METPNRIRVAATGDVKEGSPFCVVAGEKKLALFASHGTYYAIDNLCPHAGGPLCEGQVKDDVVTCPWHGSQFNIETGEVVHGPAKTSVTRYPVEVSGSDIYVVLANDATDNPTAPKSVAFRYQPTLDKERPFAFEAFLTELLAGLRFPFKLYQELPLTVISQSPEEIDLYLGAIHITEIDLKKISDLMSALNAKWDVEITYCLFHSSQFPGAMLLNIRGPKAPMNIESDLKY